LAQDICGQTRIAKNGRCEVAEKSGGLKFPEVRLRSKTFALFGGKRPINRAYVAQNRIYPVQFCSPAIYREAVTACCEPIFLTTETCSVENLCEHACPTLNHRAENSHGCIQPRLRGFVSLDREFDSRADSVEHGFQLSN
jgi:hypothetical protein